jgi:hypothetical protein
MASADYRHGFDPTGGQRGSRSSVLPYASAWLLLAGALSLVVALLLLPLRVPIGPMYWDTYTYYDAANRMLSGQVPVRDFFMPAGPLGYVIAAIWIGAFPNGQPALLLHWSTLTMSLPLMALVLAGLPRETRPLAPWLVLPFLLFSLLPFNGKEFYPFPGSDGFGYYNRQVCLVLFPLVAGLVFMRQRALLVLLVAASMLVLFWLKITGFVAAGLICAFGLAAGRLKVRDAVAAALVFAAILGLMEVWGRLVSEYVSDIVLLLGLNSGSLLPRIVQALSLNFGIVASLGLLVLVLIAGDRSTILQSLGQLSRERSATALAAFLDRPAFWLAVLAVAGIVFESQNTGSQAMIFLWPVLLLTLSRHCSGLRESRSTSALTVSLLSAAVYLPLIVNIAERAARAYLGAVGNVALGHNNLKTLGNVSARPHVIARAQTMATIYAENRAVFEDLARRGEMPASLLYSEFDFQILYLTTLDGAIDAIHGLEAQRGIRFDSIMSLNFTNPVPWLMGRRAPTSITVGADPFRAVPPLDADTRKTVAAVDLVLLPTCPPTPANLKLELHFAEPLARHTRARLTPCYDVFIHSRFK